MQEKNDKNTIPFITLEKSFQEYLKDGDEIYLSIFDKGHYDEKVWKEYLRSLDEMDHLLAFMLEQLESDLLNEGKYPYLKSNNITDLKTVYLNANYFVKTTKDKNNEIRRLYDKFFK